MRRSDMGFAMLRERWRGWRLARKARAVVRSAEWAAFRAAQIREAVVYRDSWSVPPIRSSSPALDLHHPELRDPEQP
jgi:hypothetical protein